MKFVQVGTGGDEAHIPARGAYEKSDSHQFRQCTISRSSENRKHKAGQLIIVCGLPGSGKTTHLITKPNQAVSEENPSFTPPSKISGGRRYNSFSRCVDGGVLNHRHGLAVPAH